MNEVAACPRSPIAENPSALLSPPVSPSPLSNLLPVHSMPTPECQLYCNIKNAYFLFVSALFFCIFVFFLCEKYHKPITVQHCIADWVSWVSRLTLLDL